jgi:transcriptional regulator with XRE-family HTH domain
MQRGGAVEARVGIGEALAEARGRAGLTVTEVSQRTRISETIIRGIEGGDFSACGDDLYARADIRSIAGAVGADPEPLIREYDEVCRGPGALPAVSLDELFMAVQTSGRRRLGWMPVLGLAVVMMLGSVGFVLLSGSPRAASIPPAAADHKVIRVGSSRTPDHPATVAPTVRATLPARTLAGPAATVRAYVAAINGHDYARAWSLGGRNTGRSYPSFVSGFSTTARDTLTMVSVSGDVVTARLTAQQTDGTVDTYQGTYTVDSGVIVGFDVFQVG